MIGTRKRAVWLCVMSLVTLKVKAFRRTKKGQEFVRLRGMDSIGESGFIHVLNPELL